MRRCLFRLHPIEMDHKMKTRFGHQSVQSFAVRAHLPSEDRLYDADRDLTRSLVVRHFACQRAFEFLVRTIKKGHQPVLGVVNVEDEAEFDAFPLMLDASPIAVEDSR